MLVRFCFFVGISKSDISVALGVGLFYLKKWLCAMIKLQFQLP